ncbi:alpha/beta fold hydrolase [Devosia sp. A8/3-2]|nr:alpha/beta fold hydrolase [Devosia sp. A8/3-2]
MPDSGTPKFTEQDIAIDGVSLHVTLAGDTNAPGLLLLHGMPNSSRMFKPIIPTLAASCRVVAPDLPGYGASDVIRTRHVRAFR